MAQRGLAHTFENFGAVEQMGKSSVELSKSLYYSWIPYQYIGNFNLAEVSVHWKQGTVRNAQEKGNKTAGCLSLKAWMWFGVLFASTYQQVLMGVLGNLILMSKGADGCFSLVLITVDVSLWCRAGIGIALLLMSLLSSWYSMPFFIVNTMSRSSEYYGEWKGCSGNGCTLFCSCIGSWIFIL